MKPKVGDQFFPWFLQAGDFPVELERATCKAEDLALCAMLALYEIAFLSQT